METTIVYWGNIGVCTGIMEKKVCRIQGTMLPRDIITKRMLCQLKPVVSSFLDVGFRGSPYTAIR